MKTRYKLIIVGMVLTTTIFGTHQSLMYQCGTLPVFVETPRNPNLWNCLEIWENESKQYPPPLNLSAEENSGWRTDEDYCHEWCDQNELYDLGCEKPILAHLTKYSNLLDEEFDGNYGIEDIGLPEGVSQEKFNECVDFILEKRTSMEFENENIESEPKILECYALFHCDESSPNFESCISAKKDGITIEQICLDSDITIDDGCATIVFPDSTKTVSCHYEDRQ